MKARRAWQLQTAKNRFSEFVERALSEGPQIVTRRGKETAVLVSMDAYRELTGERVPRRSFVELLLAAPKVRGGLAVSRSRDTGRKVEIG
jgi:antitoxin Phd